MNDHDYNQNPEPAHSGMETAAIILGILALIGSTCFYLSIPCAAIGILLALLSRGRREHMSTRAKTGLCISAAGLVLTVGLTSYTVYHYKDLFSSSEFQQRMKVIWNIIIRKEKKKAAKTAVFSRISSVTRKTEVLPAVIPMTPIPMMARVLLHLPDRRSSTVNIK